MSADQQAELDRLHEALAEAIAIFDAAQAKADAMVARGSRRGAAIAATQPPAARAMARRLREVAA